MTITTERLPMPTDPLTIVCIAYERMQEALGGLWAGKGSRDPDRPVLHDFEARWSSGANSYIGWHASVGRLYSPATRWQA